MTATHPSDFALDRGGSEVDAHVATCPSCQERTTEARRLDAHFGTEVLPRTLGRVRARHLRERTQRRRWWAIGGSVSALAVAAVLLVIIRPRSENDWDGIKGATPANRSGLSIFVKRGKDVRVLEPGQSLRAGDAVRFVAKLDRPRYVELRARDGAGRERTLFPEGATAMQLTPGQALPGGFVIDAAPGPERLTILLADHSFAVGQAPAADVEVVRLELPKEP